MTAAAKFLCDEMLQGLGHWLRAAGYDTLILAEGEADPILLRRARDDGRLLLTRDRALAQRRDAQGVVVLLNGEGVAECAQALSRQVDVDWLYRPFSRCLRCNTLMQEALASQRLQIPVDAQNDEAVCYCPRCAQLFWQGGHVRRMRARLQRWAQGVFDPEPGPL